MQLEVASYAEQSRCWPVTGRHILAQFDAETIVVYQAYRPEIGRFAIRNGRFGGEFSYGRMSWLKPNFLWMMYRSDWGRTAGQEVILGLRLRRTFFDRLLELAVPSSFDPGAADSHDAWKLAVRTSEVRLQWDPDHSPTGQSLERRAIQLGLRGESLRQYGQTELLEVIDMTDFVHSQRDLAASWANGRLETPIEHVYAPATSEIADRIRLDAVV